MLNPFVNRTENRLSIIELIKTIFMTISGIALARMILVIILSLLMLFTLFLTSVGYYSNEENLGRCARILFTINQFGSNIVKGCKSIFCKNQLPNNTNFHEMSRTRRCLLFLVQVYARCILYVLGYFWIKETFPGHKNWLVFPSYMEREHGAKICLANHVSFVDSFYFLSRCVPRSIVIQANVVKPFMWALNAFSPIVVPVTQKQREQSKPTKELIHANLESRVLKRPLIIFPEGGTTESNTLIKFQSGAFIDLQPVQPIALKYTYKRFDPSWTNDLSPLWLLYRMCCQFVNHLSVEYYEILRPDLDDTKSNFSETKHSEHLVIEMNNISNDAENTNKVKEPNGQEVLDIQNDLCGQDNLIERFKNKVYSRYLNDPFFVNTPYSLSDSRITSRLKSIHKIPISYVTEHILANGVNGVSTICKNSSIHRNQLEKIIVRFYNCNKVTGTLNLVQFTKFMEKCTLFDVNKLFNVIKTTEDYITFSQVLYMLKNSSNEQIMSCSIHKGEFALKLHDLMLEQICS
jgi:1-acyl-sn-glycerol-3-phosphate acyltransferase